MADKDFPPGLELGHDLRTTTHTGFWGRFRNYFLTGLVVTGPLAITAWLIWSFVTPLVYAIPVQLIAYHTAVVMGTDVDQPRNLAKSVTVE